MTEKAESPTWMYHHEEGARLFSTAEDAQVAEKDGWVDSPDKAKSPKKGKK